MDKVDILREQQEDDEIVIDLSKLFTDMWKGLKKFWWLICLFALIGACVLCLYEKKNYFPLYKAHASFTVKTRENVFNNETNTTYNFYYDKKTADQLGKTFPYILSSDVLRDELKEALGTQAINGSISANSIPNSNLFTLTVSSANKEDALKILNAVIQVYPNISQHVIGETQFQMVEEPEVSEGPVNHPNYKKKIVYGAGGGVAFGVLLLLFYALSRKTIRKPEDLREILNTECLATLPEQKATESSILSEEIDSRYLEGIWSLQNRVEHLMKKQGQQVLLITSTTPNEGKSTISWNLALAMAQRGRKVLLMDGDLRKSDLNSKFQSDKKLASLTDVLKGKVSLEEAVCQLEEEQIMFLGTSKKIENPYKIIASEAMDEMMKKLRNMADIIIIDAPPCEMMADVSLYWKYVDNVLYVVRQDWVHVNRIIDAIQELPESASKLTGCILNRAKTGFASYGYGRYGYGRYGYGHYGRYGRYGRYGHYGHYGERGRSYGKNDSYGE